MFVSIKQLLKRIGGRFVRTASQTEGHKIIRLEVIKNNHIMPNEDVFDLN